MQTIRGQLLSAFSAVIVTLTITSLFFLALSFYVTRQYKSVSDSMIAEYQLVDNVAILIDAFNRRLQSAGAQSVAEHEQQRIRDAQERIKLLIHQLDNTAFDRQSRSDYLGFKASIEKFTLHIDESLRRFEQSNIKDYDTDFNEANKQYGYLRENGTTAVFSQLKYAASIRGQIEGAFKTSILLGSCALVLLLLACATFALRFSRRLVTPLSELARTAEKIAAGDTLERMDIDASKSSVEIQSLTASITAMVKRLFQNIEKVEASKKTIEESAKSLESRNDELARLNRLMVDRELKMIELKKEIEQLRSNK